MLNIEKNKQIKERVVLYLLMQKQSFLIRYVLHKDSSQLIEEERWFLARYKDVIRVKRSV